MTAARAATFAATPRTGGVLLVALVGVTGCVPCAEGEVRDGDRCVSPCNADVDCRRDQHCVDGRCQDGESTARSSSSSREAASSGVSASDATSSTGPSSASPSSASAPSSSASAPSSSASAPSSASSGPLASSAATGSVTSSGAPSSSGASSSTGVTSSSGAPCSCCLYADADHDGAGATAPAYDVCQAPAGAVATPEDCNDDDPAVFPGAGETCNQVDDNCDGATDEGVATSFFEDRDGDGHGRPGFGVWGCTLPAGYSRDSADCNDDTATIRPGAPEACNGWDDDCDGVTDGPNAEPGPYTDATGAFDVLLSGGSLSGWTPVAGHLGAFVVSDAMAARGGYSVRTETLAHVLTNGYALQKEVPVTPETTYVLSGFFHTRGLAAGSLYLDLDDLPDEPNVLAPIGVAGWQFGFAQFTVPADLTSVTVRLVRDTDIVPGEAGYVDEVALTPEESFRLPGRRCGPVSF